MRRAVIYAISLGLCACSAAVESDTIDMPLEGAMGNAVNGAVSFASRDRGHCVLCHMVEGLDVEFQGNLGPDLSNVGARLSPAQLRLRLVDYDRVKPGTTMPPYYRKDGLHQVAPNYRGKTLLPAQDIEDIIAYLSTLKDS